MLFVCYFTVRVFTSLQEKAPTSGILLYTFSLAGKFCFFFFCFPNLISLILFEVVMGSVVGILTNGAILSQIIMYQKPTKKEKKKD
ncbi:hypothetical protein HanLR1_Chr02g0046031 [Helianthus annuus]|nr:hypothetical protein HanLR1_Chr02g0046031 [Helianthus annuus]